MIDNDPEWIADKDGAADVGNEEKSRPTQSQYRNLQAVNAQLVEVMNQLAEKIPKLTKLEDEYYRRYYKLLLTAQERTESQREASAKLQLRMPDAEGNPSIYDEYQDLKLDVRILLTKKEMLIEISRNLRAMR